MAMLKDLKKFFTESVSSEPRRVAPRVDARGEAVAVIDSKRYRLKNWSTAGVLVGPYGGGLVAKQRSRLTMIVKDGNFNIEFDADVIVTRVDDNGLACKFFYLNPAYKKQIEDYLKYYGHG
ncbi:MAG: hypothetical protein HY058_04130 [Proteobacteria bacterium]|nr:hypothetical protein [Pseudomonadota bacterium]